MRKFIIYSEKYPSISLLIFSPEEGILSQNQNITAITELKNPNNEIIFQVTYFF